MFDLHPQSILIAFALLLAANSAPILASRLLGERGSQPVDSGCLWRDGLPILGPAKTWRGILFAIAGTTLTAPLLGLSPLLGAAFGALSMAGDLVSSFMKRRIGVRSSHSAHGLDQIPEAVLPTLCLARPLGLGVWDLAVVSIAFLVLGVAVSRMRP